MAPHSRKQILAMIASLVVAITCAQSSACLRDALDDRAVEWSSAIVVASLASVGEPIPLSGNPSTQPASGGRDPSGFDYQLYTFDVTAALDGSPKVGDKITVIRFVTAGKSGESSICGQHLAAHQVGKSFLLLLRPEADLAWGRPGQRDPRSAELHGLNTYAVVHLELMSDIGPDGLADARYTISNTRAAEKQFKADDARLQAQTVISAADDTEEQQAEQAILDMGPKALDVLNESLNKADDTGKDRLQKLINRLNPPPLTTAMKAN